MIKDFKSFVFVSVDVKGLADAFFVSVDVKRLNEKRWLEVRCRKSDGEVPPEGTHVSPWFVSKGPPGSEEPFGMRSAHILAFFLTFLTAEDCDCGGSEGPSSGVGGRKGKLMTRIKLIVPE